MQLGFLKTLAYAPNKDKVYRPEKLLFMSPTIPTVLENHSKVSFYYNARAKLNVMETFWVTFNHCEYGRQSVITCVIRRNRA